jgi:hypothetical protein
VRVEEVIKFDTFITSVSFSDDSIEITFLEKNEQAEDVMMARTMVIYLGDDENKIDMYADIQDSLRMLIEIGYIDLRNPPDEYQDTDSKSWAHRRMIENSEGDK